MKKHIPNIITLLNLFSGCIALIYAIDGNFYYTFLFVCLGIFFDFFDGFFARIFKVSSSLGLQLDSLADMVTSGLVPGFVMYRMLSNNTDLEWLPYLGFLITLGSCYRLAKFNIDTRQTDSFIGLPTPANALFIISLSVISGYDPNTYPIVTHLHHIFTLLTITILSAFALNMEVPLFSLKIKQFDLRKYTLQIGFIFVSVILLLFLKTWSVPIIILSYIVLSIINNKILQK
ncbi:MAG: CDP-alcohol phosphatidyltransferase family protein [Bacteroidota bacterium]|nr:CDP-alcohol phosphatidyltransferase family protein [Bacteroidota bacterium]